MNKLLVEFNLYGDTNISEKNIDTIKKEINNINKTSGKFIDYLCISNLTAEYDVYFKKAHFVIELFSYMLPEINNFNFFYFFESEKKYSLFYEEEEFRFVNLNECFIFFLQQKLKENKTRINLIQKLIDSVKE